MTEEPRIHGLTFSEWLGEPAPDGWAGLFTELQGMRLGTFNGPDVKAARERSGLLDAKTAQTAFQFYEGPLHRTVISKYGPADIEPWWKRLFSQ